jgi:hypothetical protein
MMNKEIYDFLTKKFLPESILVIISSEANLNELQQLDFFAGKGYDTRKTKVYICKDFTCSLPLETINEIERIL